MVIAGGTQTKVGLPLNAAAAERASSRAVDLPAPAGKRSAAAPPEDDEGDAAESDEEFEIDKVLKEREKNGNKEYFVRWVGEYANSWEPEENVNEGALEVFRGWCSEYAECRQHGFHPFPPKAHPSWRKKHVVAKLVSAKPKFNKRLTPDAEEGRLKDSETGKWTHRDHLAGCKGWKAKPLGHSRHLWFEKEVNSKEYKVGPTLELSTTASARQWADNWLPQELWDLEASEGNIYQKISTKRSG